MIVGVVLRLGVDSLVLHLCQQPLLLALGRGNGQVVVVVVRRALVLPAVGVVIENSVSLMFTYEIGFKFYKRLFKCIFSFSINLFVCL